MLIIVGEILKLMAKIEGGLQTQWRMFAYKIDLRLFCLKILRPEFQKIWLCILMTFKMEILSGLFPSNITTEVMVSGLGGSLALGMALSPWSLGLIFYIAFVLVYELGIYVISNQKTYTYSFKYRVVLNLGCICGWLLGRILLTKPIFDPKLETQHVERFLMSTNVQIGYVLVKIPVTL